MKQNKTDADSGASLSDAGLDAERYRWLRRNFDVIEFRHKRMDNCLRVVNGGKSEGLDVVIDELRKALATND